jgi:hypothetical protein
MLQIRVGLFGRYQSDMVTNVRHDQHFRSFPPATTPIPQPDRSSEWRGRRPVDAGTEELRSESQRYADGWNKHGNRV